MNKKEVKEKIKQIKSLYDEGKFSESEEEAENFVLELFRQKKYKEIVEADKKISLPIIFEVAYSYNEAGNLEKAEEIYELILSFPGEENNSLILNNLSNIKKSKGQVEKAFDLIKKAYEIDKQDEIISRNYFNLEKIIKEKIEEENFFKVATDNLKKETEWALNKLSNFLQNIKKEVKTSGGVAIPMWKFKVLIGTDDKKADSLKEQWLQKGYIKKSGGRNEYGTIIYEVNPYLEESVKKIIPAKLNQQWFDGFESINAENLSKIGYFDIVKKIEKVNKKYQKLIKRDFDELVFNYFVKNRKSAITLAGSFVELLFTYCCEKKNIKTIEYTISGKKLKRDLYDCRLSDFINYYQEKNSLKSILIHIGNLTRTYRNFIHPGNEIKSQEDLDDSKMAICFHSVIEITKSLLK